MIGIMLTIGVIGYFINQCINDRLATASCRL